MHRAFCKLTKRATCGKLFRTEIFVTKYFYYEQFETERQEDAMEKTDQQALYTETIHKFLTMYRHLRYYSRQMQQEGVSGRKIAALRRLLQSEPLTVGQLRDYLYISDSSTSELIAHLQKKGFVTRTRSELDNRVVIVALTDAGREFAQSAPLGGISLLREKLRASPETRLSLINEAITEIIHLLEIENGY